MLREISNFDEISECYYKAGMTPEQCRAARAWLDWPQRLLADKAQVSSSTILDFESGRRVPHPNNLREIRRVLEEAGVQFAADGSGLAFMPKQGVERANKKKGR
jgi:ribosome-binding protein aMBF1 (putative translation factor)